MALVVIALIALLGGVLIDRSRSAARVSAWTAHHLVLQQLADSGAEELYARPRTLFVATFGRGGLARAGAAARGIFGALYTLERRGAAT